MREEQPRVLEEKMREAGLLSTDDRQGSNGGGIISEYQWYLILRKFGGAPHARFGMDFERLVGCQWIGCVDIFASVFLLCLDGLEECYFLNYKSIILSIIIK